MHKRIEMAANKNLKQLSWGARYILLILSRYLIGYIHSTVKDKTVKDLANKSFLSERSVSNHIKELNELGIIGIERELIFGKGRGVNSYTLYERFYSKTIGLHSLIIDRILFISNLTPIQKFILIILVSKADGFGVIKGLGFSGLMKMSGISRNALKANVRELIDNDFIFDYTTGGNLPIFLGKIKGVFYLNFIRYNKGDLINYGQSDTNINYTSLELTQRFNKGFKFIDFDVQEHFDNIKDKELKEYLNSLTAHSYSVFFNIITSMVHFYSGALLSIIQKAILQKDIDFTAFISELKDCVFEVKGAGSIISVDLIKFREVIKNITGFMCGELYTEIRKELFNNFSAVDKLDELRNKIYSEVKFLVTYYASRIHLQLCNSHLHPNKYIIVRDFRGRNKLNKDFYPALALLQLTDISRSIQP